MRAAFAIVAGCALVFEFAGARAAAVDPAAILSANRAASGGDAWNGKAVMKTVATLTGQGLTGTATSVTDLRNGNSVSRGTLGPATFAQGFDGTNAWQQGPNGEVNVEKGGDARPMALDQAYQNANLWWRPDFGGASVKSLGDKPCDASTCAVLEFAPKGALPFEAWFDTKTHLLERTVQTLGGNTTTTILSGYRSVDGARIPYKTVINTGHGEQYLQTLTLTSVAFLPAQPAVAYAPPKVTVKDFSIANHAAETTFPFHLYNNHIYADAWVNGKGPLLFIFDTGGQNILTPATAKALGIKVEGKMPGLGVGNKAVNYGLAKVASLRVGEATLTNQVVGVLEFEPKGEEGVDFKGMIGFAVFKRFVTRIDYGTHQMTLMDPAHFDPRDAGTPIPFVFNGDLPEVDGTFEGIPAKFDIDTGDRDALTLLGPFARAHHERAAHPRGVVAVDGWGVGGASHSYVTRGKELTIGPAKMTNVVTSLSLQKKGAFASPSYQGNVGASILKHFVVTFDYANHTMYLKPVSPGPLADVGTFDRSGMWINQAKNGMRVMDVTANGPAAHAGIKAGDVITEVDGKPATSIHVYDLRHTLSHDAAGTVMHFAIKRGTQTRNVAVRLRDQI
ncbi:MAG: aspartyl protease family protein [Rhodanobacteraceae bacterium]